MKRRRATFRTSDLVLATGPILMRCVDCGHEQVHEGPHGVQHCGRWMLPVNRPTPIPTTN